MIITVMLVHNNPSCLFFSRLELYSISNQNEQIGENNLCTILRTSNENSFFTRERNVSILYIQFCLLIIEIFENTFVSLNGL